MILKETKKKGNIVETLQPYLDFYIVVPKRREQREEYLFQLKGDTRDILRLGEH